MLSYGCEVWAPFLLKNLNDSNFINICDKPPSETLHIKVCKILLGVNKKATNNAVRGELGNFPLLISMLRLTIKYWWVLNKKCLNGCKSLVIDALIDNRKLVNSNAINNGFITSELQSVYNNLWFSCISNSQTKLRSYCLFKKNFCLENYVTMFNHSFRSNFSKLRISAHSLMIEKGRHFAVKVKPQDRVCKLCNLNQIEDEFHLIMKCPFYDKQRAELLTIIYEVFDLANASDKDIFVKIMSVTDYDCLKPVIQFVNSAFESRVALDI